MASRSCFIVLTIGFAVLLISPAYALTCSSQKFSHNKLYSQCSDLPYLSAYLHWTYNASNSSLSVAFVAPPPKSDGWVAWAINPTGTGMAGSQAIVAFKSNGTVTIRTYNISSYSSVIPSKLSFEVWNLSAEHSSGTIKIFATVKVPEKATSVNQVWQVGPGVNQTTGWLEPHAFTPANLNAKGVLELGGKSSSPSSSPASSPVPAPSNGSNSTGEKDGVSSIRSMNVGLYLGVFLFVGALTVF